MTVEQSLQDLTFWLRIIGGFGLALLIVIVALLAEVCQRLGKKG